MAVTTTFTATTPGEGPCWILAPSEKFKAYMAYSFGYEDGFEIKFAGLRSKAKLSSWARLKQLFKLY